MKLHARQQVRKLVHLVAGGVRRSAVTARSGITAGFEVAAALRGATLGLIFPGTCLSCHAEMDANERNKVAVPLCEACLDEVEIFVGPTCRRCGAPLPDLGRGVESEPEKAAKKTGCYRCRGRKLWFDETIAVGLYAGRLRDMLLRMKRAEGNSLSLAVGELIWRVRHEQLAAIGADMVVPIPLHWRRRIAHRTNSAALLGEVLARRLRRPLAERLLRRRRATEPQFSLTPPQRWDNVRQAFSVRGGYHLNKAHVLLVDDILTTGATCSEAARTMRKAGAAHVTVVVAARAIH